MKTQPSGETCSVTNGSGTASTNVANVQIACVSEWTWMGGGSTVGTLPVANPEYTERWERQRPRTSPGDDIRDELERCIGQSMALRWGWIQTRLETNGYLNDLWKFNPATGHKRRVDLDER